MSAWERPDEVEFKTDAEGNLEADFKKSGRQSKARLGKHHA